jgi:ParB family transcriptional regulator, chromosome partitioning protein
MRKALGKGLSQLIANEGETSPSEIPIDRITPNKLQPRTIFAPEALEELAASIKEHGILQPLAVRESRDGTYEIIAGERRFRAAQIAGLKKVPIVVREADNRSSLELALVENVQREDISAIECARAYKRLMDEFGLTQEEVSKKVGKSRVAVTNCVRLLRLPPKIQKALETGEISEGHGRALLAFATSDQMLAVFQAILARGLSVRDVERLSHLQPSSKVKEAGAKDGPFDAPLRESLATYFGSPVKFARGEKGGHITIDFFSDEDLQRILDILGISL